MARKVDDGIEGAQAVRDSVRARLKRQREKYKESANMGPLTALVSGAITDFIDGELLWLDGQAERAASRPGGVERAGGRKGGKGGGR